MRPLNRPRPLLVLALLLLLASWLLPLGLPQRPDADRTAVAAFDAAAQARFGRWLPVVAALGVLDLRHAVWPNLAGVLLTLWALEILLTLLTTQHSALGTAIFALGLLVALSGWGWERSRGWWGELSLTPETVAPLGPDGRPVLAFERFDQRPAPAGPGRALAMTICLDGRPVETSARAPLHADGWTIQPHWYGALTRFADGTTLFFGLNGTQSALVGGEPVTVTLDITTLQATVIPPQPHEVVRFAVIRARYAPGSRLRLAGLGLIAIAAVLTAARRPLRGPKFFSKRPTGL
ncbi:MAG: hypothetical protein M5U01_21620 [Ardenticatenaceae bacterium]|nr:hypothetical protein [Ardenticatenaceae bacterium]